MASTVLTFTYNDQPITATALPPPAGLVLPAVPPAPATTIPANAPGLWNGINVFVAAGESTLVLNGAILVGAAAEPATTSAASTSSGAESTSTSSGQPTASTSNKSSSGSGVSDGGVAGIAVGCFIGGAMIGALLFWLFMGRKRQRGRQHNGANSAAFLSLDKSAESKAVLVENGASSSPIVENSLPQPLEDKAISDEVSTISNAIKNHVQSYYHSGRVTPAMVDLEDFHALGSGLPISAGTLSTLLQNADTREIALRFAIAWVLVSRMNHQSDPKATFLPPDTTSCLKAMTAGVDSSRQPRSALLSKWRTITAELMRTSYMQPPFSETDPRKANMQSAVDVLDGILHPYADSRMDNAQRRRNLEEMTKRAASFAFVLFSQPTSWQYDWSNEHGVESGSLVIFPALVQTASETGDLLQPPRPFSQAVVRQLDG